LEDRVSLADAAPASPVASQSAKGMPHVGLA
jgi:hypothetical protein